MSTLAALSAGGGGLKSKWARGALKAKKKKKKPSLFG